MLGDGGVGLIWGDLRNITFLRLQDYFIPLNWRREKKIRKKIQSFLHNKEWWKCHKDGLEPNLSASSIFYALSRRAPTLLPILTHPHARAHTHPHTHTAQTHARTQTRTHTHRGTRAHSSISVLIIVLIIIIADFICSPCFVRKPVHLNTNIQSNTVLE